MALSTPHPDATLSPLPSSQSCEIVLGAIDLFIHKERAALQAEIRRLQAENAALLKENSDLLRKTISTSCSSPNATLVVVDGEKGEKVSPEPRDDVVATLVDKVHHYQRFLVKERENSVLREASFDQNFHILHKTVKDALRPTVRHHHHRTHECTSPEPSGASDLGELKSPPLSPKSMESASKQEALVSRVMALSANLAQRSAEMKQIRQLAESKAKEANLRIAQLERKSEGLSVLRAHNNQVDLELEVLKLRLKKLETMALEFVPLVEQDILLDFEAYKDELLKVQTRQKQRRKKEARWNLWRD